VSRPAVPAEIMRRLRREVNWGCPVESCGSPYLTYHHFDPPWEPEHRHNEPGMIAQCHTHHTQADGGTWTPDQLRQMKAHPFLAGAAVKDKLNWLRMHTILAAGGGYCFGAETFVEASGQQIVWFTRDSDGRMLLNVDLRDAAGAPLFTMIDNDWIVAGDVGSSNLPLPPGSSGRVHGG